MSLRKDFELTEHDNKIMEDVLLKMSAMLFVKMDKGIKSPEISGSIEFNDEKRILQFSFKAIPK